MESLNNKKILIVRLSAIGDTIHGLPVLGAIKREYPGVKVCWLVERESSFLLQKNPLLEKVFIFEKNKFKKTGFSLKAFQEFKCLVKSLKAEQFDITIDLQGLFKSGLLTALSGAKRRIGFKNTREFSEYFLSERVDIGNIFDHKEHVIQKNMKLAEYLGIKDLTIEYPLPGVDEKIKERINLLLKDINPVLPLIGIIPATTWASKFWKEEYWQQLLQQLTGKANIIFTGIEKDNPLINRITEKLPSESYINLVGKTTLFDLIELFSRLDIVIGVDTGPLHLAVSVNKPDIIAILGPTSATRNGAFGHRNLVSDLPCQPCHSKKCPNDLPALMQCMDALTPERVFEEVEKLLARKVSV